MNAQKKKNTVTKANKEAISYEDPISISIDDFAKTNEERATLSHWIHNLNTPCAKTYEKGAKQILPVDVVERLTQGKDCLKEEAYQQLFFEDLFDVPFPPPESPKFTFIDLFAGIGGFRLAMQNLGGKCVFSSEWDENAQKTYLANFGEVPFGDITKKSTKDSIPESFDVLCAGFPCQAFSIAGHRKGFEDTRGTLFFDVAEIIKSRRPKAVFLENVKNLVAHDSGKTFSVIKATLEGLGYVVYYKVMNAAEYADVPQNRERIFIICLDPEQISDVNAFAFPERIPLKKTVHDCIDASQNDPRLIYTEKMSHFDELKRDITDKDSIYQWRRQYVRKNQSHLCPTLTANMGTGGHNVPLILINGGIRKLSPKECLNFQGFPTKYFFPDALSMAASYKQAGNSVVTTLIQKVGKEIVKFL